MEFSRIKKLIKRFNTLKKTPLEESGSLSTFYYLLAAQASTFLIHTSSQTESVRPHMVASNSLCSTCVTYGTPCHAISHQLFLIQPFLR